MQIFRLAEIHLNAGRSEVCRVIPVKYQSDTLGAIDLGLIPSDSIGHGDALPDLEGYFLASLLFGHPDIFLFAGGGRTRTGILSKILALRARCLVRGTALVPPIAAMGLGMVFQDRHRWLSV